MRQNAAFAGIHKMLEHEVVKKLFFIVGIHELINDVRVIHDAFRMKSILQKIHDFHPQIFHVFPHLAGCFFNRFFLLRLFGCFGFFRKRNDRRGFGNLRFDRRFRLSLNRRLLDDVRRDFGLLRLWRDFRRFYHLDHLRLRLRRDSLLQIPEIILAYEAGIIREPFRRVRQIGGQIQHCRRQFIYVQAAFAFLQRLIEPLNLRRAQFGLLLFDKPLENPAFLFFDKPVVNHRNKNGGFAVDAMLFHHAIQQLFFGQPGFRF